ncbi:hypothetical protein [Acinetobacter baumannii]|uniref:hypothetical protein n=1 Tax=Acinetobacter baumannii TaxID=470 RepID=UPI000F679CF1|nr:hypothetical protein [Acinetobacter baumannii]RSF56448.1 hypothetical protein EGU00_15815 [Acinetobacter baumannii]
MVRGIANSKIGFGDLILLLRYFFKLKVSTHPSQQIKLFEYGKDTLQEVKKHIKDNSFVKNQDKIQDMIETLYKLSKN